MGKYTTEELAIFEQAYIPTQTRKEPRMIAKSSTPSVAIIEKVREYYKTNKKLGGLISITETIFAERMGRELFVLFPDMAKSDTVLINGVVFVPKDPLVKHGRKL